MARYNNGIYVPNNLDPVPTDAQGGYAGGDSTAAQVLSLALGCGLTKIAFLVFMQSRTLKMADEVGLVTGRTAPTSPTGAAIC